MAACFGQGMGFCMGVLSERIDVGSQFGSSDRKFSFFSKLFMQNCARFSTKLYVHQEFNI